MSLRVDEGGRRGRSRSPGRREERDRSRGRVPEPDPLIMDAVRMPSPPAGFSYDDDRDATPRRSMYDYNDHQNSYRVTSPTEESSYRRSREKVGADDGYGKYPRRGDDRKYARDPERDHDRDHDRDSDRDRLSSALSGAASFLPAKYSQKLDNALSRDSDSDKEIKKREKKARQEEDLAYGHRNSMPGGFPSRPESPPSANFSYAKTPQWEYDKHDDKLSYNGHRNDHGGRASSPPRGDRHSRREPSPGPQRTSSKKHRDAYGPDPRSSKINVLTVEPGQKGGRDRSRSPRPPVQRMSSLSVNSGFPTGSSLSLANAPGSPLLESYHGTYQSMSPMPSPLLLASNGSLSPVEPLSPGASDDERGDKKKRRARFSDPVDDAARLAKALKGEKRAPDTEPLIEILPGMTQEQVMELRQEYKRLVKTGSERKGVNIAKHIRARLKDEDPLLMKACYTVALGKWESESYWANFWYQGDKTRRELLIESIMGRTNDEIRKIKDGFSDKKYRDSLTQCMKTELKEDKFKKAVLMVLDERRMEEYDEYGRPMPIDRRLVEDDVQALHKAVKSEKGGESAMIQIVIMRSDSHLRDVLKLYEKSYRTNFARDALKKSGNLVGELLAHILNGVINKPVRDALLIHHALSTSKKDQLRRELLISRLVRYHWDRHHMAAVKKAYRERYGSDLREDVKDGTSGEWGLFCEQLCVARIPDDVKRF
ncbi:annexin ANXC4 [Xylariales sp. AK1849]|nr:annexin ANXC4 [Xylariales sp. AK1849]